MNATAHRVGPGTFPAPGPSAGAGSASGLKPPWAKLAKA